MTAATTYLEDFLKANPRASEKQVATFLSNTAKELVAKGRIDEGSAVTHLMLDRLASSGSRLAEVLDRQAAGRTSHLARGGVRAGGSGAWLPEGIAAGKAAAIVAGIGLAVAGAYAIFHQRDDGVASGVEPSWVDRVDQHRLQGMTIDGYRRV